LNDSKSHALIEAQQRAEAAFEELRTHWSPNCIGRQAEAMRDAAEKDHDAISAALKGIPTPKNQCQKLREACLAAKEFIQDDFKGMDLSRLSKTETGRFLGILQQLGEALQ
jgi:hypothetical protein